jgi:hypothetical protein
MPPTIEGAPALGKICKLMPKQNLALERTRFFGVTGFRMQC